VPARHGRVVELHVGGLRTADARPLAGERDQADVVALAEGQVAAGLGDVLGIEVEPESTGTYRAGDIRHCFADITRGRTLLGFEPETTLEDGMRELAEWLRTQTAEDRVDDARAELVARGLAR
jgi:nucleoside-diphosphate-sugar epimerase